VAAALAERGWRNAVGSMRPSDRGYWRAMDAAVTSNAWDLVWRHTVNFNPPGAPTGSGGTLHTLPGARREQVRRLCHA
jgi:hypothetical protein